MNAGPDYVRDDFVAAESVRVVLRCDRQILHRAVSLFAEHCRRKVGRLVAKVVALGDVDGDGDVDATDILLGLKRARGNAEDLRAPTALGESRRPFTGLREARSGGRVFDATRPLYAASACSAPVASAQPAASTCTAPVPAYWAPTTASRSANAMTRQPRTSRTCVGAA